MVTVYLKSGTRVVVKDGVSVRFSDDGPVRLTVSNAELGKGTVIAAFLIADLAGYVIGGEPAES